MRVKGAWSKYERALLVADGGDELRILGPLVPFKAADLRGATTRRLRGYV